MLAGMNRWKRRNSSIGVNAGYRGAVPPALRCQRRCLGWTMLELMIVISIMMILMAVAVPLYRQHVVQAREAVLKQNLFQLDSLINQYKLDKEESPQSLDDLVTAGYLSKLPVDPMTGKADWTTDQDAPEDSPDPQQPGIKAAHSASTDTALNGEAYSSW
jgi:general secretion pathway protein G